MLKKLLINNKLSKEKQDIILYGSPDLLEFKITTKSGNVNKSIGEYEGVVNNLERRFMETSSEWIRDWLSNYMIELECPKCHGARLDDSVLNIFIDKKNIFDITCMSIKELLLWFSELKLAKELQKKPTGKSLFILDEPTTGLHTDDIKKLLVILQRIVDNGDTVIVIEHNLDVIKVADYIIDLGPEGGSGGGNIVAKGTPEDVAKVKESYTGEFLKKIL